MKMLIFSARTYEKNAFEQALPKFTGVTAAYTDATFNLQNISLAKGYDAVCIFVNHVCDRGMVALLAEIGVKHILLRCAGFNNVDLDAVKEYGLGIARVPQYSPYAVAEHALGLLMCLNRKIHKAHLRVRENNFALNGLEGFDIFGKNVGIIGFGKIGQIMATIFSGFQVQTYVYDPVVPEEVIREKGCIPADLAEIAANAHIISLHCPLNEHTHHIINRDFLSQIAQECIIVNSSRGGLINTDDIIHALRERQITGLALDVYEEEEGLFFNDCSLGIVKDTNMSILQSMPNVLITGHQAFLTHEALQNIASTTLDNLVRLGRGDACWN